MKCSTRRINPECIHDLVSADNAIRQEWRDHAGEIISILCRDRSVSPRMCPSRMETEGRSENHRAGGGARPRVPMVRKDLGVTARSLGDQTPKSKKDILHFVRLTVRFLCSSDGVIDPTVIFRMDIGEIHARALAGRKTSRVLLQAR